MNSIRRYTKGMKERDFLSNPIVKDATMRHLEIIGEASRHLSAQLRRTAPNIPWKQIIAMRNILIHEYSAVDEQVVWSVVQEHIPSFRLWVLAQLRAGTASGRRHS